MFCYLFKYSFVVPTDCDEITLPDAPELHIFSAVQAAAGAEETLPAYPLYD